MEILTLVAKTFLLRPYVLAFLLAFLFVARYEIGLRRALAWIPVGYAIAFLCELSSTHNGFPFGLYHYYPAPTRDLELWVLNVPFMDSLSFAFLSFASYATARRLLGRSPAPDGRIEGDAGVVLLGATLMVAIDLVCDPVSLRGDQWFLGRIYDYAERGIFFGVPLSNFAGWFFVACAIQWAMAGLERAGALGGPARVRTGPGAAALAPALWASIVLFNAAIAFWIGLPAAGVLGLALVCAVGALSVARGALWEHEPRLEEAR